MRLMACAVAAGAVALLAAAPGIAGKGGPTPDPLGGWDGVVAPTRRRPLRRVAGLERRRGRRRARQRRARAPLRDASRALGDSAGRLDGTTDGISADGGRLVLASIARGHAAPDDVRRARTRDAAVARRIDAPRPLGVRRALARRPTIYAIQYRARGRSRATASARSARHRQAVRRHRSSTSASRTRRCAARR